MRDLGPEVASYQYQDEDGQPLFEVVRFEAPDGGKEFRQRAPDGTWSVQSIRKVPFHLPELLRAVAAGDSIYVVEGEKDVLAVEAADCAATCNPGGAGKWQDDWAPLFDGAHVIVVQDKDDPGEKHARKVYHSLKNVVASIRVVEAASGKDAADHLKAGERIDSLVEVSLETQEDRTGRLRILTATEIEQDRAPREIVERLIHEDSLHSIVAPAKGGKSFLALQLGLAVSHGEPFLGQRTRQVPVLYVSTEPGMSAAVLRGRLAAIARDVGLPAPDFDRGLRVAASTTERGALDLDLTTDEGRAELRDAVRESGAGLVVLDTFYSMSGDKDMIDNLQMKEVYLELSRLGKNERFANVLLDHSGKSAAEGLPVSLSAIGASSKGGACNTIIQLNRQGGAWEMKVASHFGTWDDPLVFTRPMCDGKPGFGVVPTSHAETNDIDISWLQELFESHGERSDAYEGCLHFGSATKLKAALAKNGITSTPNQEAIDADIRRQFCFWPTTSPMNRDGKPIEVLDGSRSARIYVWRWGETTSTTAPI
ncbi:MAG: AAA family ATPase [Myxococcota bacterium]